MRILAALLLQFVSFGVYAASCGPGTELQWDYGTPVPGPSSNGKVVDGFKLYVNDVEIWTGTTLTAIPDLGTVEETKTFYVTAYNDAEASSPSSSVSCEFVTGAPAAALNLRFVP